MTDSSEKNRPSETVLRTETDPTYIYSDANSYFLTEQSRSPLYSKDIQKEISKQKKRLEDEILTLENKLAKLKEEAEMLKESSAGQGDLAVIKAEVSSSVSEKVLSDVDRLYEEYSRVLDDGFRMLSDIQVTEALLDSEVSRRGVLVDETERFCNILDLSDFKVALPELSIHSLAKTSRKSDISGLSADLNSLLNNLTQIECGIDQRSSRIEALKERSVCIARNMVSHQQSSKYLAADVHALKNQLDSAQKMVQEMEEDQQILNKRLSSVEILLKEVDSELENRKMATEYKIRSIEQEINHKIDLIAEKTEKSTQEFKNLCDEIDALTLEISLTDVSEEPEEESFMLFPLPDRQSLEDLAREAESLRMEIVNLEMSYSMKKLSAIEKEASTKKQIRSMIRRYSNIRQNAAEKNSTDEATTSDEVFDMYSDQASL